MSDPYHKAVKDLEKVFWRQTKILWGSLTLFLAIQIYIIANYF